MGRLFRFLRADEIDCRIGSITDSGLSLLLYKDARCDMNILDETFGPFGWQRHHSRDNANCIVSVYDEQKGEWIEKEDTGTESNTEALKGIASDSFKRACFNWGIGRELYTAPFIWITASNCKIENKRCKDKFRVVEIGYNERGEINRLLISNDTKGVDVFEIPKKQAAREPRQEAVETKATPEFVCEECHNEIKNPKNKEGKPMDVKDYVAMCMRVYGRPICDECRRKRGKAS